MRIDIPRDKIARFCQKWRITEFSIFGSALRDDFGPESDVDVLVSFEKDARWSLLDHATMEDELSFLLNRKVDLLTRRSVERSSNWIRRKEILATAEPFYVQG